MAGKPQIQNCDIRRNTLVALNKADGPSMLKRNNTMEIVHVPLFYDFIKDLKIWLDYTPHQGLKSGVDFFIILMIITTYY
jgi:hypothetical protein